MHEMNHLELTTEFEFNFNLEYQDFNILIFIDNICS